MTPTNRLAGIHALRTVAAVSVFLQHVINLTAPWSPELTAFARHMHFSVPLFFALSAFSLMYSTTPYQGSAGWVWRFYFKRYFRIAPLFYAMLVADTLLQCTGAFQHILFPQKPWPSLWDLFLNITFLFEVMPGASKELVLIGWSVGVEMIFYALFPLILLTVRGVTSALLFLLFATLLGELTRPWLSHFGQGFGTTAADFHILTNLSYFAYGVLAFHIYKSLRSTKLAAAPGVTAQALAFHTLCALISLALIGTLVLHQDAIAAVPYVGVAMWGGLFVVLCVWVTVRPARALNWAPFQYLGERSYSLYLVHLPALLLLAPFTAWVFAKFDVLAPTFIATSAAIAATYAPIVALCALTYRLIEAPGMSLGKRVERRVLR